MATLQELEAKITELEEKVELDVQQGAAVIAGINDLLSRTPGTPDYQAQVDRLNALIAKVTSDNPAIQAALDAIPPVTPPQP